MSDEEILDVISGGLESCGDIFGDEFHNDSLTYQKSFMAQSSVNCDEHDIIEYNNIHKIFNGEIYINDVNIPKLYIQSENKEKIKEYFGSNGLDFFEINALKVWFITIIEEFGDEHIETEELYSQKFLELINSCKSRMNEIMNQFRYCQA